MLCRRVSEASNRPTTLLLPRFSVPPSRATQRQTWSPLCVVRQLTLPAIRTVRNAPKHLLLGWSPHSAQRAEASAPRAREGIKTEHSGARDLIGARHAEHIANAERAQDVEQIVAISALPFRCRCRTHSASLHCPSLPAAAVRAAPRRYTFADAAAHGCDPRQGPPGELAVQPTNSVRGAADAPPTMRTPRRRLRRKKFAGAMIKFGQVPLHRLPRIVVEIDHVAGRVVSDS